MKAYGRHGLLVLFVCSMIALMLLPLTGGNAGAQPAPQSRFGGLAAGPSALGAVAPAPGAVLVDTETFRKQLDQYAADLQDLAAVLVSTGYGKQQAQNPIPDLVTAASAARQAVASYTPQQLATIQAAFSHDSAWRERPRQLKQLFTPKLLAAIKTLNENGGPMQVLDQNCNSGPGTPHGALDAYIAEDVTFAAQSVMELLPTDALTIAAREFATAAFIAAEVAHKVLDQLNGIYVECESIKAGWRIDQKLPLIDVAITTRASQGSLDNLSALLTTRATQIDTAIANLRLRLDTRADTIDTAIANTNTNLTTRANTIDTAIANTNINLGNRATQIDTEIANTNANLTTRANQIDTEIANTNANLTTRFDSVDAEIHTLQTLNLRAQIEANLLQNGNNAIALFALPASVGGYLETTRDIVSSTIAETLASGQDVGQAQSFFAAGQAAYAAHQWKLAYTKYQKAYVEATK